MRVPSARNRLIKEKALLQRWSYGSRDQATFWVSMSKWFMVKPHTSDMRVTYEWYTSDIWVTYKYTRVTYEWHACTYEWHTSTYVSNTDDMRLHASDIWMTYKYMQVSFSSQNNSDFMGLKILQIPWYHRVFHEQKSSTVTFQTLIWNEGLGYRWRENGHFRWSA